LNVLAGAALAGAIGFAWWSSRQRDALPPPASTGSADATHPAPLELFASAKVGDWYAWTTANESPFGSIPTHAVSSVTAATATTVRAATRGWIDQTGELRDGKPDDFPRAGLTLERLTGDDIGGWTLFDVTIVDEPHLVNGRTFACKRITYGSTDPMFPSK